MRTLTRYISKALKEKVQYIKKIPGQKTDRGGLKVSRGCVWATSQYSRKALSQKDLSQLNSEIPEKIIRVSLQLPATDWLEPILTPQYFEEY
jgi:hypothetical protein